LLLLLLLLLLGAYSDVTLHLTFGRSSDIFSYACPVVSCEDCCAALLCRAVIHERRHEGKPLGGRLASTAGCEVLGCDVGVAVNFTAPRS